MAEMAILLSVFIFEVSEKTLLTYDFIAYLVVGNFGFCFDVDGFGSCLVFRLCVGCIGSFGFELGY